MTHPRYGSHDPDAALNALRVTLNLEGTGIVEEVETFRADLSPERFADLCDLVGRTESVTSIAEREPRIRQAIVDAGGRRN